MGRTAPQISAPQGERGLPAASSATQLRVWGWWGSTRPTSYRVRTQGHQPEASNGWLCTLGPTYAAIQGRLASERLRLPGEGSDLLRQARQAIRDAIVEQTSVHVAFDPEALDHAYDLLIAAEPERERDSVCGRLSVGFPVRGEDYEDAPNDD